MKINELLAMAPANLTIQNTIITMRQKLDIDGTCVVAVSGGSDSDILVDLVEKSEKRCKVIYVFYDTGIEYQATLDHLAFLEEKYGIEIQRIRPKYPIPNAIKKYGVPLFSKKESEYIDRLQKHHFDFTSNETFESDYSKHPKSKSALMWWHNAFGEKSSFNISQRRHLKEFLQANPPPFAISSFCCQKAKKEPAYHTDHLYKPDLKITGIRKAEGGGASLCLQKLLYPI